MVEEIGVVVLDCIVYPGRIDLNEFGYNDIGLTGKNVIGKGVFYETCIDLAYRPVVRYLVFAGTNIVKRAFFNTTNSYELVCSVCNRLTVEDIGIRIYLL